MHTTPHAAPGTMVSHARSRQLVGVFGASLLLAVSSWIAIPIGPVPVTLQTLAVVWLASVYGSALAVAAVTMYLLEGAAGLPVLAQGASGLHCFIGPTGGYLMGFLVGAYVTGALRRKLWNGFVGTGVGMLAGQMVILAFGASWLARFVGIEHAMTFGVLPFMLDTLVKTIVGTLLAAGSRDTGAANRG